MLIHIMQVLELMKTHVVKTTPQETLRGALDLMDLYQVDGLPVVDAEGRLCGMLTEQNIWTYLLGAVAMDAEDADLLSALHSRQAVGSTQVIEVMTSNTVSVAESLDVTEAALLLLRSGRKRLPVLNAEAQVIGTFNRVDVCQALFEGNL